MKTFEYQQINKWGTMSDAEFLKEINEAGSEGWRLIGVSISDGFSENATAFLEREVERVV